MSEPSLINAMTIDVEDYFHVSGFADRISPEDWDHFPSRVVANTERVLELLAKHNTRGTFFVLGWVADRFPQLVKSIHSAGHEVGCHSYWHRLVYQLTPEEFRQDVVQARDVLQSLTGDPVTLFRAPSFSVTQKSLWALEVLAEEGFRCDSSVYPVYHDRYGFPSADPLPHRIVTAGGVINEFPGAVIPVGKLRLAVSGGGYFRLYPVWLSQFLLQRINMRTSCPFMFYIHPWELDPHQPRMPGSLLSRFRHYQNLATTERKMDRLLPAFRFGSMSESLASSPVVAAEYALADDLYNNRAPAALQPA